PVDQLAPAWSAIRDRAEGHGRDADALRLVVRAIVHLSERPVAGPRGSYHGSVPQVVDDLVATAAAGADEVVLGLAGVSCLDELLDGYARLAEGLDHAVRPTS